METKSGGEMETQSGSDSNPNRTLSVTLSPEMDSRISEFVKLSKIILKMLMELLKS